MKFKLPEIGDMIYCKYDLYDDWDDTIYVQKKQ